MKEFKLDKYKRTKKYFLYMIDTDGFRFELRLVGNKVLWDFIFIKTNELTDIFNIIECRTKETAQKQFKKYNRWLSEALEVK